MRPMDRVADGTSNCSHNYSWDRGGRAYEDTTVVHMTARVGEFVRGIATLRLWCLSAKQNQKMCSPSHLHLSPQTSRKGDGA